MDRESVHQGWLECFVDAPNSKSWMKLTVKKPWKRRYLVLYHLSEDTDKMYLASYEKDENWNTLEPKKVLELYPRYKIAKIANFKGRENVLEVNNESEQWYLSTDKSKIIDLWATQIQMQTKLSRAISGRIFSVSGAVNKQMQRIGAAQQRCLLHFTRWGITLALQDSRAILAMWPLKTIRNYESSQQCQFSIEAGRRAPMGQGVFVFNTNIGQDEEMFSVVDAFVTATLNENAQINPRQKEPTTDEEILRTYDQLHRSATGMHSESVPQRNLDIDMPGYAHIGREMSRSVRSNNSIAIYKPPDYNHSQQAESRRNTGDSISPVAGFQGTFGTPRGLSFSDNNSYDQLDRKGSWGSRSEAEADYDHIHQKTDVVNTVAENPYDKIDRSQLVSGSAQNIPRRNPGYSGFRLRDEPSVPFLDDNDKPFQGRSPLSSSSLTKTPEDEKYEFRNSIYTPAKEANKYFSTDGPDTSSRLSDHFSPPTEANPHDSANSDLIDLSSRHGSTASESEKVAFSRNKQRASSSIKDKSIQDIADHFLYQMPSTFSPPTNADVSEETTDQKDVNYQNMESVRDSVFAGSSPQRNIDSSKNETS